MKKIVRITILLVIGFQSTKAQALYDISTVQEIELNFSTSNWDYILDSLKNTTEDYYMADWVKINGVQYDSVGVRFKGNSSYNAASKKNPLHIALDKYKNQKHQRYEDIKLSNGYADPSQIREALGYHILGKYMHCPQSNFAKVTINGAYYGLFTNDESIDKKFLGDHFYSDTNCFVKCSTPTTTSSASKNSFFYLGADSTSYMPVYDIKSDGGWTDFMDLCQAVTTNTSTLHDKLDMDRAIWMLAFNNLFVNLDSYNGVYAQNHYTYKDHTGHFNPIVWDLNMCFGAFLFAGQGTIGIGQKSITELKEYSPFAHATDVAWPLINDVLGNATWKRKYVAHLKTMLQENVVNNDYQTTANQFQSLINPEVINDTNKLFSLAQFQNGLTSDVVFGNFTVPGIANLMEARKTYLLSLPEFTAVAPSISNYVSNPINPHFNTSFALTANIQNADTAYVGYRFDITQKFKQVPMYDDGMHGDVAANDNIYGCNLNMQGGLMQYYIYAENPNAGLFAPQRAEHEYYAVGAMVSQPVAGELTINELLADNVGKERDEYGDTEDWLELYNNSNKILNLSGCYLSDDVNALNKWPIPDQTYLNPNDYLMVWLDDDSAQHQFHSNFKLNKDSGHVFVALPTQSILDSVSYGAQTTNVSLGRYPNGTGPFMPMNRTFKYINNNDPLFIKTLTNKESFTLFPNPSHEKCQLLFKGQQSISVWNMAGVLLQTTQATEQYTLDTRGWQPGMYVVKCGFAVKKLLVTH